MPYTSATKLISSLKAFLDASVCNFYAASTLTDILLHKGFVQLNPSEKWNLKPDGRYFVVKNNTAVFAFVVGSGNAADGFKIISAHLYSPGFRIIPSS